MKIPESLNNNKGMVLIAAVMFMAIISVLSITAVKVSTTDIKITANNKTAQQLFYLAEAGIEEARQRLSNSGNISDGALSGDPDWKVFIASDDASASAKGYVSTNPKQSRTNRLSNLNFIVKIEHQKQEDPVGSGTYKVLYLDTNYQRVITSNGNNIYILTSYGISSDGSEKQVVAEISKMPPLDVTSALYVKSVTTVGGGSLVNGNDLCGTGVLPGISTTLNSTTVTINGAGTTVDGTGGHPSIQGNGPNMNMTSIINNYKNYANITDPGGIKSIEGPWGVPQNITSGSASCSVSNIIYVSNSLKLTSHSKGCGILLVNGDLEITGGIDWYGLIIISGSLKFTGVGNNNGIAGAIMTGGTFDDNQISGNTEINYCGTAIQNVTQQVPTQKLSWKESY
ncbi:MAG: pilus assembly PilX N-terminal domain-containing protein [Desulfobacterales bacterium]|nr:pilus assembly PilX N-terminal domain-containing protein [Desulfobacterales bacterium]MBF0398172.1 pilus assembly PilX N-terminal domain-containing protein [Desulfobacterales bacterium]